MYKFLFVLLLCILHQVVFSQVNPQTGAAVQSFPLINYSDGKSGLSLSVAANYNSGNGLQVGDLASDLGTGWNLQAGGVIVRLQTGQPDDQVPYFNGHLTGDYAMYNYPAGYLYNQYVGRGCHEGSNYYPVFPNQNTVYKQKNDIASDLEQDKFIFNMNGHYGAFIIGKNWQVTTLGDSKLKISVATANMTNLRIRTRISSFTIITEDGIKYTFSEKGLSKVLRYKHATRNGALQWIPNPYQPSDEWHAINRFYGFDLGDNENPYIVNSWYLSSMENTNNGAKIFFDYGDVDNDIITSKYLSQNRDLNNTGHVRDLFENSDRKNNGRKWFSLLSNPGQAVLYSSNGYYLGKLDAGPTALTYSRLVTKEKKLVKIWFPDNSEVHVNYNAAIRADGRKSGAISAIKYLIDGNEVRSYEFTHGYLFKNSLLPYNYLFSEFEKKFARLCLLSIQKKGNGQDDAAEPPYHFSYYAGSPSSVDNIVPPRNSLSIDHWGYYNGSVSGLSVTEDHDFLSDENRQYAKMLLATSHNPKPEYAKNGLLSGIIYPAGGTVLYEYAQNKSSYWNHPHMNAEIVGGVSVSKVVTTANETSQNIITEYAYKKADGSFSRWGDEQPHYTNLSFTYYDQTWGQQSDKYTGIEYPEAATPTVEANVLKNAIIGVVVGFAIQQAIALIFASSVVPVVNAIMLAIQITLYAVSKTKTYEFHRFTISNTNNALSNPIGSFNSRVEIKTNSPTGYNGKTVIEYTDVNNYPLLQARNEWPWTPAPRIINWAYGLPKKITVYDKYNNIVSEKLNEYKFFAEKIADADNLNCKCATRKTVSMGQGYWQYRLGAAFTWATHEWMTPIRYYSYTGRTDLVSSSEKNYTAGNLHFANTVNIQTDPKSLLQKGKVIAKDANTIIIEHSYYPMDYTIAGPLQTLKTRNAIHTPVATETWMIKINGSPVPTIEILLLDAAVTEYKNYTINGYVQVKPWRTFKLKTSAPIPVSVIGQHNPAQLLRLPSYFKQTAEFIYDAQGNLVETDALEQKVSYINDYKSKYVTASVVNASYTDIAYSSFESDGKGSWNYATHFVQTTSSLSGSKGFALSGSTLSPANELSTITRNISSSKTYILTYWVNGAGSCTVNGQPGEIIFDRVDGWKLYSHEITGASSISIQGDGLVIDELRLYPKGALMNTVVYKEGIGKVAECDANNRILYYEYDVLGRLLTTRDQNRNIIKTYEYNFLK